MAFDGLGWLIGDWVDDWRAGEPGTATGGGESWRLQLDGQILVRASWCEYPATASADAFRHDDILVVSGDPGARLDATFWDNDGHVIRYTGVSVDPDGLGVAMESGPSAAGPRQRLRYRADGVDHFTAGFDLQLPGATAFSPYLEWRSSRGPAVAPPGPGPWLEPAHPSRGAASALAAGGIAPEPSVRHAPTFDGISGVHAIVFTSAVDEVRSFFRDSLALANVDAGDNWPIFALPPAELAVHPADAPRHELYLICDDLEVTLAGLERKGVEVRRPVREEAWGRVATIALPGATDLAIYQPKHRSPR